MRRRTVLHHSRLDADPVVTGLSLLLACVIELALVLLLFPPPTRDESVEEAAMRFGYRGPTRYLREIHVQLTQESPGSKAANRLLGNVRRVPDSPTGGEGVPARAGGRTRGGQGGLSGVPGEARESMLGSLRGGLLNLPRVQSEELVIRTLVKPDYPLAAVEQGLEGRVELLALVDVTGSVEEVRIVHSAGKLLDGAATNAVRRCRFEPYKRNGRVQAVYASFKFNFTLLDR